MAGARYKKFDYTIVAGASYSFDPSTLALTDGVGISNVRGFTVGLMGPAGGTLQPNPGGLSPALRGYVLIPSNVLVNNAPEASTMRWVRCPQLDLQNMGGNLQDAAGYFDLTALGIVAFRAACVPEGIVYDAGTSMSLVYSARLWGI